MTKLSSKNGFAIIDKDPGWTSHDVVARARKILDTRKIGHSGTLDPPATGVLILGIGKATRLLRFITDLRKEYVATMVLGSETDTLDADGEITQTTEILPSLSQLQESARNYVGDIQQVPPMVSAVKIKGKRLYQLAREGKEVHRDPRNVTIHHIEIDQSSENNVYQIKVSCGSGTYIRSLVSDIAEKSGSLAHVGTLRRTAIGSFDESLANPIDGVRIISMSEGLRDYEKITVNADVGKRIKVGSVMGKEKLGIDIGSGPWPIVDENDELLAVYENYNHDTVKPAVVISQD
ncbi:MAG TPA: tRNA pseudouridine(55) synthase TruB [Acidimicrobiales bacterium]|nr:tRNA pseudouridine(55) synthase TruB [Acidimicrobiales bacterium]